MLRNNHFKLLTYICLYFIFILIFGYFIRNFFSVNHLNFPTWTYNSGYTSLNSLTSWDSGFYYDIAQNNYPNSNIKITKTEIEIPSNSWVKIFLGAGLLGTEKIELPSSKEGVSINNLVLGTNQSKEVKTIPIYLPYEGITYCLYKGELNYERDVKSFKESLSNNKACGDKSCDKSFVTLFDVINQKVVFQENFSKLSSSKLVGNNFPETGFSGEFQGLGCKTITQQDIVVEDQELNKKNFTSFAFMPLYPFIVKLLSFNFVDLVFTGVFLSFIYFLLSSILVKKISEEIYVNSKFSYFSALIFILIPGSFYQFTFLEISQFTFFSLLSIYFCFKSRNIVASIALAGAIYTNIFGIFLLIPIYLINKKDIENLYFFIVSLITLIGHSYLLYLKTGNYYVLLDSKIPWYNGATTFLGSFYNYFLQITQQNLIEIFIPTIMVVISLFTVFKNKLVSKLSGLYLSFLGILILNGSFSGVIKYIPLISLPLIIQLPSILKNKFIYYFILFLFLITNIILFSFWTLSLRYVI